ncbi:MAG: sulfotransferase [Woeseiaceae bacterium]|nr:sulfotransferase [Woeseiaceae bacterium]
MAASSDVRPAPWMQDTLRQGFALLASGRAEEASECARRLLGAKPDLVEGHFLVGLIAVELKQNWTAVSAFGSVTKLKPDHAAAWAQLARLFMVAGQPGRADVALARAVEHNDDSPVVLDIIGNVYNQLGDQEQASEWMQRALERQPQNVGFIVNVAYNEMFLGNLDRSEEMLRKALELQPENANAHWVLSNVRKAGDRSHIAELEQLVRTERDNPRALSFLYYGMGKEFEDLELWDEAFDAFAHGASAKRKTLNFDEQAEIEMFEAFGRIFTADWLEQGADGHDDPSPIFVVGQPRTGTTLVERIITAHSQVYSAGELKQFGQCVRRLADYREPKRHSAKLAELAAGLDAGRLGKAYMATTAKVRGDLPRFVDKLPPNYLYIPLILKALPNARIVHLTRHPMDACFASFKQLFADAYSHSYDQAEMARHHARYYHLMATWRERFPGRFFDISYEATAGNLEPNARALIEFLELPWEDACLEFHKQKAAVSTASAVQVRQPAHTKSVGRWRRYERQLEPMFRELERQSVPLESF